MPDRDTAPQPPSARPRLARRARLRWDDARGGHVLLLPESYLALTPTAAEVIELCDGTRSIDAIVAQLAERHRTSPRTVDRDVRALLERLKGRGWMEFVE